MQLYIQENRKKTEKLWRIICILNDLLLLLCVCLTNHVNNFCSIKVKISSEIFVISLITDKFMCRFSYRDSWELRTRWLILPIRLLSAVWASRAKHNNCITWYWWWNSVFQGFARHKIQFLVVLHKLYARRLADMDCVDNNRYLWFWPLNFFVGIQVFWFFYSSWPSIQSLCKCEEWENSIYYLE